MERDNALQQLADNKSEILSEKFDELLSKLSELTIKKFRRFLEQKDENQVISSIKNDLKLKRIHMKLRLSKCNKLE
jgi:hypothetical protein